MIHRAYANTEMGVTLKENFFLWLSVSEQVYQDYDKLNNKYETETTTLHKALEVASKVCIDMILPSYRVKDNVVQRWCRGTSEHSKNILKYVLRWMQKPSATQ